MNAVMTYASLSPSPASVGRRPARPTGVGRMLVAAGELLITLGERTARRPQPDLARLAAHAEQRRDLEGRAHSALWP